MRRLLLLLTTLLLSTALYGQEAEPSAVQLQKLNRFYRYLNSLYVEEVDMEPLVEEAIRAMLLELDPHSNYLDKEEMRRERETMQGEFCGIGIEFRVVQDTIRVVQVLGGGAAAEVGLRAGDRILRIDSVEAVGMKQHQVPTHIRGKEGSTISILALRPATGERLHFTMNRRKVELGSVSAAYLLDKRRGYIKVERFGYHTYDDFRKALEELGPIDELVVDLQGNGGGLLQQAVAISGCLLRKGQLVVSTEGRATEPQHFTTTRRGAFSEGRLILLVDEFSASASEIVSGAVQDWDRGVIIGRPTFGKGLVQRQIDLGDGSAIRLTIAHYLTPSGRIIQRPYHKGNRAEYYAAQQARALGVRDTLACDTLPRHLTLRNARTVYGGGGITPDLIIEEDTAGYTPYLGRLVRRGLPSEFILKYTDRHRDSLLRCWPDYDHFRTSERHTEALIDRFIDYAAHRGEVDTLGEAAISRDWIGRHLTLHLASALYGLRSRDRALNDCGGNPALTRAIELLNDPEAYEALLNPSKQVEGE